MIARHNTTTPSDELERLAERVIKLSPDRRDPERWHVEKDLIAKALRALARRPEGTGRRAWLCAPPWGSTNPRNLSVLTAGDVHMRFRAITRDGQNRQSHRKVREFLSS
jgi:hypothetical protein